MHSHWCTLYNSAGNTHRARGIFPISSASGNWSSALSTPDGHSQSLYREPLLLNVCPKTVIPLLRCGCPSFGTACPVHAFSTFCPGCACHHSGRLNHPSHVGLALDFRLPGFRYTVYHARLGACSLHPYCICIPLARMKLLSNDFIQPSLKLNTHLIEEEWHIRPLSTTPFWRRIVYHLYLRTCSLHPFSILIKPTICAHPLGRLHRTYT